MKLGDLPTPAFVINRFAFQKNCLKILKTVKDKNLKLRPHVKTHKTVEGCHLQVGGDDNPSLVTGFVCSTIPEVAMLVSASETIKEGPFLDILYGVPISQSKLPSIERLRHRGCTIRVMIDHPQQVSMIHDFMATLEAPTTPLTAFLKLDTGYHRAGITCDHRGVELVKRIEESPYIHLYGLYSHW
jgi:D-serine ammonia-lyase